MAFHPDITPRSREDTAAGLAQLALSKAKKQQTRKSGSATWHNEDGTKTVIGPDAGISGIAPWVGDTTAPGMPTGVGVDSAAGMILVSWDGTLKGGIPADFDHVQILVDGVEAGQLRVRGTATLGPYEADSIHEVTVRAWDDAHAEDGSPAANGSSPTEPVSVTVKSVVGADEIKDAQDKAQEAIDQVAGVGKAADAALSRGVELVRNPAFDPAWGDLDGFGLSMGTTGAPAKPPLPYATYGALTQRDYFSSWRFPLDRDRKYRFGFWCICDGKDREDLRIGWRYVNPGTHWDQAVTVTQEEASSWVWREAVVSTPDQWTDTDHSLSVWLNIAGYGDAAKGWWITGLTVRDVTDSQAAKDQAAKAQTTADGKNRTYTSQTEPAHAGLTKGDEWYRQDGTGNVIGVMIWDGTRFNRQVVMADQLLVPGSLGPVSMADGSVTAVKIKADEGMLKKLLVRKLLADEIDVGSLAAAIIQSEKFVTKDGLNGVDESGFWTKDKAGNSIFRASGDGVQATGGFQTASSGDRIQLSQILFKGSTIGGLQGIGDDPETPYWLIWGDHDEDGIASRLLMGTSTQQPEIAVARDQQGHNSIGLTANRVDISGDPVDISGDIQVNGMPRYTVGRRVYQWVSNWSGVPLDGWATEVENQTFVVPGPGEGRWYMCDMGARVAGTGEYGIRLEISTPGGRTAVRHALLSPRKNGGIDNYTSSRMVFMEAGTYVLRIQTVRYGDVSIDMNADFVFAEPYTDPHVFARYVFITEC